MRASREIPVLKLPYRGAPQTVALLIDAGVRSQEYYPLRVLVERVCHRVRSKDYLSECLALYHWFCANTRYMRDPLTVELVRTPEVVVDTLDAGQRPCLDCDDAACFLLAMLLSSGAGARIVCVAFEDLFYRGERQYEHVFVQALVDGVWVTLDPVAGAETDEMLTRVVAARTWEVAA